MPIMPKNRKDQRKKCKEGEIGSKIRIQKPEMTLNGFVLTEKSQLAVKQKSAKAESASMYSRGSVM